MSSVRQMANAPLVFVIAGINFEALEALPLWIPTIQNELRKWFPSFKKVRQGANASGFEMAIDPQDFDPEYLGSAWVFSTTDHRTIVTLFKTGMVLHTTKYTVFSHFEEQLRIALKALLNAADGIVNVTKVGIRYVDHIQPQHGMDLDKFIVSSLRPAQVSSDLTVKNSSSFATYAMEDLNTTLNVRFNLGEGGVVIPQDLMPPYILNSLPSSLQGTVPFQMLQAGEGSLDLDAVNGNMQGASLSLDDLAAEVNRLHRVANSYFDSVITPDARRAWSAPSTNN